MKFIIGLLVSFAVGAGCRYFDIPVGSPAVLPGAFLVLAMTAGYASTNRILDRTSSPAALHAEQREEGTVFQKCADLKGRRIR